MKLLTIYRFTKLEEKRVIKVSLKASLVNPAEEASDIEFVPMKEHTKRLRSYSDADFGSGEVVYLCVSVSDSGQGLSSNEKALLFQRFNQG